MAEHLTVTRPDGSIVTVTRRAFDLIYRNQGYREVATAAPSESVTLPQDEQVTTAPVSKRPNTLTDNAVVNGPHPKKRRTRDVTE